MGRRPRSVSLLALLVVVASGCIVEETDALSAGEVARNEELAALATGDRDRLVDVITQKGSEFELVDGTDPGVPPAHRLSTCRAEVPVERDLALAIVPFTTWDVHPADDEGLTVRRVLEVIWGGGGDDASQVLDEYEVELSLVPTVEGCVAWTLAFADTPSG